MVWNQIYLKIETQLSEAAYQCSFMVVSKIGAQRLLYDAQPFLKDKIQDSNCIYKKDPYAPDFHWTNKVDQYQDDLDLYYDRMKDAYEEMVLFFEKDIALADSQTLLPKARMRKLLLLMFQAYAFKELFYLDEFCHDLESFLGLAVFHSTEITGIWNRFNSTVLDLLPFFDSGSDVFVDMEMAGMIQGFYQELHVLLVVHMNVFTKRDAMHYYFNKRDAMHYVFNKRDAMHYVFNKRDAMHYVFTNRDAMHGVSTGIVVHTIVPAFFIGVGNKFISGRHATAIEIDIDLPLCGF